MTNNKSVLPAIGALGVGAGLMYLMDPRMGRRRRALIRDKVVHLGHEAEGFVTGQTKNLKNHAKGWMHEAKDKFGHARADNPMDDAMDDNIGSDFQTND